MRATETIYYGGAKNAYQERLLAGVALWASYYRANIHRFVMDFFHVRLKLFQIILLYMMEISNIFVFIASRGIGKTFLFAIYICAHCILFPGTQVCVASGTRGQAMQVIEKILKELRPNSPELNNEIDDRASKISGMDATLVFKNGSVITVVTASDSARGHRAHILVIDEFRMVKRDTIDTILRKFLSAPRHPKYLDLPEYQDRRDLLESNKTLYASSAFYADHWSYTRCRDACSAMLDPTRHNFVCGLPYELAIDEGLLRVEDVIDQISESDFNEVKWQMEMETMWYGSGEESFFDFRSVAKNRHVEYALLPYSVAQKIPKITRFKIPPKQSGERRILSADIALMASTKHKNDATSIFINQMLPTKAGRYANNIVYTENHEGMRTDEEALSIRKLYEEFECDYIVLDVRSVGLSIFDALANDMPDPDTGEIYPALSCCNDDAIAARCINRDAKKAIWAISATAKFNSECALLLREGFRQGRLRLLVPEEDADQMFSEEYKDYSALSVQDRILIQMPYINTTLLIGELIELQHDDSGGLVRIYEKAGKRKDRYSSLAYNFYVSTQLEQNIRRNDAKARTINTDEFVFRAPSTRISERW